MKELKNIGTALSIAVIVMLIFVVIWAFNNNLDHNIRINQLEGGYQAVEKEFIKLEKEKNDIKTSIFDLTQSLKELNYRFRKTDFKYMYDSLEIIENKIKGDDTNFSLPPIKRIKKKTRKNSRKYESSDDESEISETDEDIKIEMERRKRRRVKS